MCICLGVTSQTNDPEIIANMLGARSSIPGCQGLGNFDGNDGWFDQAPLKIRFRFLRILLPSIEKLPTFLWNSAFDSCLLDVQARMVTSLSFCYCGLDGEAVHTVAEILCRDAFPVLTYLCFSDNPDMTDMGIMALTKALENASQTFLMHLNLTNVGMADEGIAALAHLVYQGCMDQLTGMTLSENSLHYCLGKSHRCTRPAHFGYFYSDWFERADGCMDQRHCTGAHQRVPPTRRILSDRSQPEQGHGV